MIWRIEVRITRPDSGATVADATVETSGPESYRKLASAGFAAVRDALSIALPFTVTP
jgi:hypothetical protein